METANNQETIIQLEVTSRREIIHWRSRWDKEGVRRDLWIRLTLELDWKLRGATTGASNLGRASGHRPRWLPGCCPLQGPGPYWGPNVKAGQAGHTVRKFNQKIHRTIMSRWEALDSFFFLVLFANFLTRSTYF